MDHYWLSFRASHIRLELLLEPLYSLTILELDRHSKNPLLTLLAPAVVHLFNMFKLHAPKVGLMLVFDIEKLIGCLCHCPRAFLRLALHLGMEGSRGYKVDVDIGWSLHLSSTRLCWGLLKRLVNVCI